jgi:hypothetical protein
MSFPPVQPVGKEPGLLGRVACPHYWCLVLRPVIVSVTRLTRGLPSHERRLPGISEPGAVTPPDGGATMRMNTHVKAGIIGNI